MVARMGLSTKSIKNKASLILMALTVVTLLVLVLAGVSHATAVIGFDPGRIIDDIIFTNNNSMSVNQIQVFLNNKVPDCDTNGTHPASDFGRSDLTHAQYAATRGWPAPPYPCLKDYNENGLGTAQIIYNVAQQYQINPQVLIVLLQKEQGLVTDTWPLPVQYRSATGYGCPDGAACDSQYYGLTAQLYWAATMFHAIETNNQNWSNPYRSGTSWYTPYVLGNNYILYNPNTACGGSTVNIQNRATQALYNYTTYQPNQASLNAGYGTGDSCSSHGNRNFYLYFSDWFGGTTTAATYGYSIISKEVYSDSGYQNKLSDSPTIEPNQEVYIKLSVKNTGNQTWNKETLRIGTENPKERISVFEDGWLSPTRPAAMNENTVGGGGTATFSFKMKAPPSIASYQETFSVLIEGQRWLDGTFNMPITVASSSPYYSTQILSFETYADSLMSRKLSPKNITNYTGSKVYVKAIINNTGNQTLPADLTQIATTNPLDHASIYSDSSWLAPSHSRAAKAQEGNILPGKTGTFTFSLTSPGTPQARNQEQYGLVIEGNRWLSDNIGQVSIQTLQRPPLVLNANQTLEVGQALMSSDERYHLDLQGDGNLVLYSPTRAVWASWTVGKSGTKLVMQSDGNLVLYRTDWVPVWDSHGGGRGSSRLILQSDGNLVVYAQPWQPTWYSATYGI